MQSTGTAGTVCSAGTTPTSAAGPGPRHSGSGPAHPVSGLRRLANMRGAEAPRRRDVLLLAAAAWLGLKLQLCVLLSYLSKSWPRPEGQDALADLPDPGADDEEQRPTTRAMSSHKKLSVRQPVPFGIARRRNVSRKLP